MAKAAVVRWFIGGAAAVVVGILLVAGGIIAALAGGVLNFGGPNHVTVDTGVLAWTTVGVVAGGVAAITGGVAALVVSWIGALINTVHLDNKTWFAILFVSGLVGAGPLAMLAYVVAGPDGISGAHQFQMARVGGRA